MNHTTVSYLRRCPVSFHRGLRMKDSPISIGGRVCVCTLVLRKLYMNPRMLKVDVEEFYIFGLSSECRVRADTSAVQAPLCRPSTHPIKIIFI